MAVAVLADNSGVVNIHGFADNSPSNGNLVVVGGDFSTSEVLIPVVGLRIGPNDNAKMTFELPFTLSYTGGGSKSVTVGYSLSGTAPVGAYAYLLGMAPLATGLYSLETGGAPITSTITLDSTPKLMVLQEYFSAKNNAGVAADVASDSAGQTYIVTVNLTFTYTS